MDFLGEKLIPTKIAGIYLLTNLINNKKYIGKSINIRDRLSHHKTAVRYGGIGASYVHRAIRKYGIENFSAQLLELIPEEKYQEISSEREQYWIKCYNSNDNDQGYNLTAGGEGVLGFRHSKEWCDKHSKEMSGINNPNYNTHIHGKKVLCVETNQIYASTREAESVTGILHQNISAVCLGRQKTAGGFTWQYI